MPKARIGFVTCAPENLAHYFPTIHEPDLLPSDPHFTPDDQILVNLLRERGYLVAPVRWGTTVHALKEFDLLVIRSPWDYQDTDTTRESFIEWLLSLEINRIPVENNVPVLCWLVDKHYLGHFQKAGIPVVPTHYIEPGDDFDFRDAFERMGPYILKPTLSAAARDLFHIRDERAICELVDTIRPLMAKSTFMCQPFLPEIQTEGEWSLVFLNGEYSHAVHKKPKAGGILVQAEQGGSLAFEAPPQEIITFAQEAFTKMPQAFLLARPDRKATDCNPLYLRIDVIPTGNGLYLSECEGVEPELFIRARPDSALQFCLGIDRYFQLTPTH